MYILHSYHHWPHHLHQHQHIIGRYNWDQHCVWSNHSLVQCLPSCGPQYPLSCSKRFQTIGDDHVDDDGDDELKKKRIFNTKIVLRQNNVTQHWRVLCFREGRFCINGIGMLQFRLQVVLKYMSPPTGTCWHSKWKAQNLLFHFNTSDLFTKHIWKYAANTPNWSNNQQQVLVGKTNC